MIESSADSWQQDKSGPLPFREIFTSRVEDARERLREQMGSGYEKLLSTEAHHGWERYLLTRLTQAGTKAAQWQFQIHESVSQIFSKEPPNGSRSQEDLYRSFIGDEPNGRSGKIMEEFPGLKSLCDVLIANWLSAVGNFHTRLASDYDGLLSRSVNRQTLGQVTEIQAGLSEPHRGGRCVVRVIFENGARLIYKPRSIAPEDWFSKLLEWINRNKIPHALKSAACWDRGNYGWMEDVQAHPCATMADVRAFYWRAGALLALVHLSLGVDIHEQNLVATGPFPVLIDLETLWHPQEPDNGQFCDANPSVMRTGFLPMKAADKSSDYSRCALSIRCEERAKHLPSLDDQTHAAGNYIREIQAGFEWIGAQLFANPIEREHLKNRLGELVKYPRRCVVRSSVRYQRAWELRTDPQTLRDNISDHARWATDQSLVSKLPGEMQAIYDLDIPYFEQNYDAGRSVHAHLQATMHRQNYAEQSIIIAAALAS